MVLVRDRVHLPWHKQSSMNHWSPSHSAWLLHLNYPSDVRFQTEKKTNSINKLNANEPVKAKLQHRLLHSWSLYMLYFHGKTSYSCHWNTSSFIFFIVQSVMDVTSLSKVQQFHIWFSESPIQNLMNGVGSLISPFVWVSCTARKVWRTCCALCV